MFDDLFDELFSTPTIFSGKGSYQKTIDNGSTFIYQTNPKTDGTFYGFNNIEDRDRMAKIHISEGHEIVERVQGNTPASPYIDIDAPSDATDEDLNLIIKTFKDVATEINAPSNIIINRCDRINKRSIHIIGDGYSLKNGMDVKRFSEEVKNRLPEHIQRYVDNSGGHK